jgi:hypothetical protein
MASIPFTLTTANGIPTPTGWTLNITVVSSSSPVQPFPGVYMPVSGDNTCLAGAFVLFDL